MADLHTRIGALSGERRALLEALLDQRRSTDDRRAVAGAGQRRFWQLWQADPTTPVYNWPQALRLRGPLRLSALRAALDATVRAHAGLRTTFAWEDGELWQRVGSADVPVTLVDLASAVDQERAVQEAIAEENQRPFDLVHGPLIRVELLRLARHDHVLMIDIHNIAADAWSVRGVLDDLADSYRQACTGQPPLVPARGSYAAHTTAQHRFLRTGEAKRQLDYWAGQFAGVRPQHANPRSHLSRIRATEVPPSVLDGLRRLAREHRASLFMVLLAVFAACLASWTEKEQVVVASSVAGRDNADAQRTVGYFVNRIILCCTVGPDPILRQLVETVRAVALNAYANCTVPFEHLVHELRPDEYSQMAPLAPVMFVLDDTPTGREMPDFTDLVCTRVEPDFQTSKFELLVNARPARDGGLLLNLHYLPELCSDEVAGELLADYVDALIAAVNAPEDGPFVSPDIKRGSWST